MTKDEIITAFHKAINDTYQTKAVDKQLEGISKDVIYNWRKGRGIKPPTMGQMLDVLYQLDKIKISSNESNPNS